MCFSKELSLVSFFSGVCLSLALIIYGSKKYKMQNLLIGIFIIYVSLMQLVDYFIWIDLDCTKGYNKIASLLGYILNLTQPLFAVLLFYVLYGLNSTFLFICAGLYTIILMYNFKKYIDDKPPCVVPICGYKENCDKKHLRWDWLKLKNKNRGEYWGFINMIGYFILLGILGFHVMKLKNIKYIIIISVIIFIGLFILTLNAILKTNYDTKKMHDIQYNSDKIIEVLEKHSISEIWCYFTPFALVVILFLQKVVKL